VKHVIIDRPSLQSVRQRFVYGSVTLLFWVLWIYLWLPLLALLGWALGIRIAYTEMVIRNGFTLLQGKVTDYAIVVGYLGGSLLVWAYYNYMRFHGSQRRQPRLPVSRAEQARYYGVEPARLAQWADAKRLVVRHDADGRITGADPGT
jgi:biofilm PGA synthesis protein PgaD